MVRFDAYPLSRQRHLLCAAAQRSTALHSAWPSLKSPEKALSVMRGRDCQSWNGMEWNGRTHPPTHLRATLSCCCGCCSVPQRARSRSAALAQTHRHHCSVDLPPAAAAPAKGGGPRLPAASEPASRRQVHVSASRAAHTRPADQLCDQGRVG